MLRSPYELTIHRAPLSATATTIPQPKCRAYYVPHVLWWENVDDFFCSRKGVPKSYKAGKVPYVMVTAGSCDNKAGRFLTPATLAFSIKDKAVHLPWTGHFLYLITFIFSPSVSLYSSAINSTLKFSSCNCEQLFIRPVAGFPSNTHISLAVFLYQLIFIYMADYLIYCSFPGNVKVLVI